MILLQTVNIWCKILPKKKERERKKRKKRKKGRKEQAVKKRLYSFLHHHQNAMFLHALLVRKWSTQDFSWKHKINPIRPIPNSLSDLNQNNHYLFSSFGSYIFCAAHWRVQTFPTKIETKKNGKKKRKRKKEVEMGREQGAKRRRKD